MFNNTNFTRGGSGGDSGGGSSAFDGIIFNNRVQLFGTTSNFYTPLPFGTLRYGNPAYIDLAAHPSRFTVIKDGYYYCNAKIFNTGTFIMRYAVTINSSVGCEILIEASNEVNTIDGVVYAETGDFIEFSVVIIGASTTVRMLQGASIHYIGS